MLTCYLSEVLNQRNYYMPFHLAFRFPLVLVLFKYVPFNLQFVIIMQVMFGLRHRGLARKRACEADGGNSQGTNAAGGNSQGTNADGGNSRRTNVGGNSQGTNVGGNSLGTNADGGTANSQRVGDDQSNIQMSNGGFDDSNDGGSGTLQVMDQPTKKARGRGKKNETQLRVPPPSGKIMLKPQGSKCVHFFSDLLLLIDFFSTIYSIFSVDIILFLAGNSPT